MIKRKKIRHTIVEERFKAIYGKYPTACELKQFAENDLKAIEKWELEQEKKDKKIHG